jgi:hypothetical protein
MLASLLGIRSAANRSTGQATSMSSPSHGEAGQEVNVFLQGLWGAFPSHQVDLELVRHAGTRDEVRLGDLARSWGSDGNLNDRNTGRVTLPASGTYTVRVQGRYSTQRAGRYRLEVYAIDRSPQSIDAAVAVNDTISGESIDRPGDIDEFTFHGEAGQEVNVFLQGLWGSHPSHQVELTVVQMRGRLMKSDSETLPRAGGPTPIWMIGTRVVLPCLRRARTRFVFRAGTLHSLRDSTASRSIPSIARRNTLMQTSQSATRSLANGLTARRRR